MTKIEKVQMVKGATEKLKAARMEMAVGNIEVAKGMAFQLWQKATGLIGGGEEVRMEMDRFMEEWGSLYAELYS